MYRHLCLIMLTAVFAVDCPAKTVFDCSENLRLPASSLGSVPYDWVEGESGTGIVPVTFVVGSDGRADRLQVESKSFGLGRWIEKSVRSSKFDPKCSGQRFRITYTVVVHKKTSVDLPITVIGPGPKIRLEFLEILSGPLRVPGRNVTPAIR